MPQVIDATVIDQPYSTEGNGGRKLVVLDNGTIFAAVIDGAFVRLYWTTDNWVTKNEWVSASYSSIQDVAIETNGSHVFMVYAGNNNAVRYHIFDSEGNSMYGTDTKVLDSLLTELDKVTLTINPQGTELHAAWSAKNSTYPNTLNIRYAKGVINPDNTVDWGSVEPITKRNTSGWHHYNPSIIMVGDYPYITFSSNYAFINGSQNGNYKQITVVSKYDLGEINADIATGWTLSTIKREGSSYPQSGSTAKYIPPEISRTPKGRILVAWHGTDANNNQYSKIKFGYSDNLGADWVTSTFSGGNWIYRDASITVNKNNEVFILAQKEGGSLYEIIQYKIVGDIREESIILSQSTPTRSDSYLHHPATLSNLDLNFTVPLFIYRDTLNSKVGFYGDWTPANNINPRPYKLGEKTTGESILTYSLTGSTDPIIEKVNGQIIRTIETPVDGQAYVVNVPSWDSLPYGNYADSNGNEQVLTIETGNMVWRYPFTKVLAADASILESVKALGDIQIIKLPNESARQLIDFYIQEMEPVTKKSGDVWVKSNLQLGSVSLREAAPPSPSQLEVWQRIEGINYSFNISDVNAFFRKSGTKLYVDIDRRSIIDRIPADKVAVWQTKLQKAFGNLTDTQYWDGTEWQKVEAFTWNGSEWVQISNLQFLVYDYGTETVAIEQLGAGSITKEPNRIAMTRTSSSGASGITTSIPIDVTNYKKAFIIWEKIHAGGEARFSLSQNKQTDPHSARKTILGAFTETTTELDISSLSGQYYLTVTQYSAESGGTIAYVYKLWLE